VLDFFDRQDASRRRTLALLFAVPATVVGVIGALYLATILINNCVQLYFEGGFYGLWEPWLLVQVAVCSVCVVVIGSMIRMYQLRAGGSAVAKLLGAVPLSTYRGSADEQRQLRLQNVVEEVAIASGLPVPEIYVVSSPSINAFAAGFTPEDSVVGVTEGAIQRLSRAELQAVVAHEFSHLLNGDTRLNMRLLGVTYGLLAIFLVGSAWTLIFKGKGGASAGGSLSSLDCDMPDCDAGDDCGGAIVGIVVVTLAAVAASVALMTIGQVGAFFARLLRAAVSRQREFLADAAAVEFTRNPRALATALIKVAGQGETTKVSEEASHLFFASIRKSRWLATHPPLAKRIRLLDAQLGAEFEATGGAAEVDAAEDDDVLVAGGVALGLVPQAEARPGAVVASAGLARLEHIARSQALISSLAGLVEPAKREPRRAAQLVFALLLHDVDEDRRGQVLTKAVPEYAQALIPKISDTIDKVQAPQRLALLELLLPILRGAAPAYRRGVIGVASRILELRHFSLHSAALFRVVHEALRTERRTLPLPVRRRVSLLDACHRVLSAAAWAGESDAAERESAFRAGAASLKKVPFSPLPETALDFQRLQTALDRLAGAGGEVRRGVLGACAVTMAHDDRLTVTEAELLRAIAAALDCPVPPFLAPVEASAEEAT
jgi:Zn-dependent protease with chaperone function